MIPSFFTINTDMLYSKPPDNPDYPLKDYRRNAHISRPRDIHYPDQQSSRGLHSRTNPEAKKAGLTYLKNVLVTIRTLSFFLQNTLGIAYLYFQLANPDL